MITTKKTESRIGSRSGSLSIFPTPLGLSRNDARAGKAKPPTTFLHTPSGWRQNLSACSGTRHIHCGAVPQCNSGLTDIGKLTLGYNRNL